MIDDNFDGNPILGEDDIESCSIPNALISLTLLPKPFGMLWKSDKIIRFLKGRGYRIISRVDPETDEEYSVAVKPEEQVVPDTDNLSSTFSEEVQELLVDWMLSLKKE